jgi:succinate dehydrogenase/fumarate reductase-like Fe-S protein
MSERQTTRLKIRRGSAEGPARHQVFDLLDALRWIRGNRDATLAVRYSCINANACKECVMRIDGRTGYACTTPLKPGVMVLDPLPNKRLIRDLVTDTLPPDERL